ncbi:MAG: hypothetical protein ACC707_03900 [Thiohalomonadales bacterium]
MMNIKARLVVTVLGLLLCSPVFAVSITGAGYGNTNNQAKSNALATLSESILVEIKSSFDSFQTNQGRLEASRRVHMQSDLPLLGANVIVIAKDKQYHATAVLNSDRSIPLYIEKLNDLYIKIEVLAKRNLATIDDGDKRYALLNTLLTDLEMYKKYQTVARFLGAKNIVQPDVTAAELEAQLLTIRQSIPSMSLAGRYLANNISQQSIYVFPAHPIKSREITPFARLLRDYIRKYLNTVEDPQDAEYFYKGAYEYQDSAMSVTYRLISRAGETIFTNVIKLAPSAYNSISYKPTQISFDQLLHQGIVVSNDFRVNINTNLGSEDLLFQQGQDVELFVKLNKSGYFYIVGYTLKGKDASSYLLELSESPGKRRFITYVNADDVNKWLSLGSFKVSAPYGIESIQIIAANKDLQQQLPLYHYDAKLGIYSISGNPEKNIVATRSLRPKFRDNDSAKSAEAVLLFTTMGSIFNDDKMKW